MDTAHELDMRSEALDDEADDAHWAGLTVEHLIDMCQDGNLRACEELDRRGVEPPLLELDNDDLPMQEDDTRVCLEMGPSVRNDLRIRAQVLSAGNQVVNQGARELVDAIAHNEEISAGSYRVRCTDAALTFIREEAPDVARRWPAVFGDVAQPRSLTLAMIGARCVGKAIAGLEIDTFGNFKLRLEGGDAIVVETDGSIDLEERPARPSELAMAASDPARYDDPRGEADR